MKLALFDESREKVDQMRNKVIEAGGEESREPHKTMDVQTWFSGYNGHLWEIIYMDESAIRKSKKRP
jgi:uncharacterized protein